MSNPFAQDPWDPFGELPASRPQQQQQQSASTGLKPVCVAQPPPRPSPAATANPFGQLPAPYASSKHTAAVSDEDPFGLFSATAATGSGSYAAPAAAPPASYNSIFGAPVAAAAPTAAAAAAPPPPSYSAAMDLPPPPAYEAAATLPPPPPSYEEAVGMNSQQQRQKSVALVPARIAPPTPAVQGPLHAGMPASRQAPARPVPAAPAAAAGAVPARPAPAAPGAPVPARAAPPAPQSARAPPSAPAAARETAAAGAAAAAAAAGGMDDDGLDWLSSVAAPAAAGKAVEQLQQQLAAVHVSAGSVSSSTSSSLSSSYFSTGSIGAVPRGGAYNCQQAQQRELSAQIRLPPLNPNTAAPLNALAAGLGCLFAGPAGEGAQVLQWSPKESGTTLPPGAQPCPREDHDSGACAELAPRTAEPVRARVTSMLLAPGPGLLWCGASDGCVHCWGLCTDGTGTAARWLHGWQAHGGKKVKALALSPAGRLFTGASNGTIRMWNYGSPAFADAAPPRLLRQLCKLDARSGVQLPPHSKVIGLAVSAGGRVLWSAGKNTISLWSMHNGECLGTISNDSSRQQQCQQQQYGGYAAVGAAQQPPADINPRTGLDAARLASQFEHPAAELLAADDEGLDADKDAAAMLINTGVKAMGKASKLLNKLGNKLHEKASKMLDEGRAGSADLRLDGSSTTAFSSSNSAATSLQAPGFGAGSAAAPRPADALAGLSKGDIKKLAAAADGSIWVGYRRGVLEKYSEAGQLLWASAAGPVAAAAAASGAGQGPFRPAGITALAAVGSSVWVGDNQGQLWVLDAASAALQRSWKAHVFPVRSIAAGGPLVYSLGKGGSIRVWPALPAPAALTAAWQQDLAGCLKEQQLTVLVGTWNVNEMKPSRAGLQMWLTERAKTAQLVMIGLQEVEMGTMSVGKDAISQYLAKSKLESGTSAAQAWAAMVGEVLQGVADFRKVGLRQMSGVLVMVFARSDLEPHTGEVATASVACGVMGYGGNKGAVAVSFSLFRRRVVIVSSHFAAHQDKVESRNADYAKIVRHLHFHNVPTDKPQQLQQYEASGVVVLGSDVSSSSNLHMHPYSETSSSNIRLGGGSPGVSPRKTPRGGAAVANASAGSTAAAGEEWGPGMRDAELLVWVGDFNYRVDQPDGFEPDRSDPEKNPVNDQLYLYVHRKIGARQHLELLSGDQCIREVARGTIFHGLAEGPICFLPTYKFEKGRESNALQPFYDQGEKKRVPAWTDRVLFRGSGAQRSALQANAVEQRSDVRVSLASPQAYNSLMEVNDSDHKPVYAMLNVQLPWYQQQQQRGYSLGRLWQAAAAAAAGGGSRLSSCAAGASGGSISLLLEPQQLLLQGSFAPAVLQLRNPSRSCSSLFVVQGSGPGGALPTWLEVVPTAGVIVPGGCLSVRVQGAKAQWQPAGGLRCELCVLGCLEGSVDSSRWPVACYQDAQHVPVVLP